MSRVKRKHEMRVALMEAGYTVMQWSHSDLVSIKKGKYRETFATLRSAYNILINH